MAGALIVTAEFGARDLSWLDGLRRRHFPPERNQVPAHLTIFHALPAFAEEEVKGRIRQLVRAPAPTASIEGLMNLGGGVAFRVVSPALQFLREELARGLHGLLSAQDSHGWRPHVTIQNKVPAKVARALMESLERDFTPRPLVVSGIGLHRYLDGPWETIGRFAFRP